MSLLAHKKMYLSPYLKRDNERSNKLKCCKLINITAGMLRRVLVCSISVAVGCFFSSNTPVVYSIAMFAEVLSKV